MRVILIVAAWLVALAPLSAVPAAARSLAVDDLLNLEELGQVSIAPGERWMVAEVRGPYAAAASFQGDYYGRLATSRLYRVNLDRPGPAELLLGAGGGYVAGPIAPDGRAMVVYRLSEAEGWRGGVLNLADRSVRWLEGAPDYGVLGRTAQWRSSAEVVFIRRRGANLPVRLRLGWNAMAQLPELWRRADRGEAAVSVAGSGRFSDMRPSLPTSELVVFNARTGAEKILARDAFVDLEISPDGRHVAALVAGRLAAPSTPGPLRSGETLQRHTLQVIDLERGGISRPLAGADILPGLLAWSPVHNIVLIFSRRPDQPWREGALAQIDAATGRGQTAPAGGLAPEVSIGADGTVSVRAGWLGRDPVILARDRGARRADWYALHADGPRNLTALAPAPPSRIVASTHRGLLLDAADGVWSIDTRGRAVRLAVGEGWVSAEPPQPAMRLSLNAPPARDWTALLKAGPGARLMRAGPAGQAAPDHLPAGRLIALGAASSAVLQVDEQGVGRLQVKGIGGAASALTLNAALADITPARVARLDAPGGVAHWLYLPPTSGSDQAKPPGAVQKPSGGWPMVVVAYPGAIYREPPSKYAPGALTFYTNPQLLAAQGYAVLVPSLPRASTTEPMQGLTAQILAAANLATASGEIDRDRVALWGHSFGGYAAMAAATETQRFKAVIASAGISDLANYWGAIAPDFAVSPELGAASDWGQGWVEKNAGMGGPPWTARERYARNSPFTYADQIETPMLLIQGDQDSIGLGQAQALFSALHRQDKPAVLATYWGESHVITSPGNVRDMYARVFAFLAQTLAPSQDHADGGSRTAPRPL
ncbi:hypothetical protein ASE17_20460 [Phenylobacterium sp. Root77]|jgi:dipeptidyl aminopeptidase/acylaminoacyl peptidase|uniref:alpha/beta hydrolase family protein n=1 Tax=unclassified Phenylobacterium TaxID=2640670 RepID=UPI0006FEE105|nr:MULTISPECIES: prolyl oligopeptidase family serine peptidase [unclassified Phenylobacterium]KQW67048.1 hypothetical protein ASC73_18145 [Phenylobacterium sp. Root1277]KQW89741.1 hypothetical protein ASC79_19050 [Phenylobacterium sp. Root1290]KRC43570.1 hypothetical protein ASE17_20460 [Phenylobacterium sp. Root77]